MKNNLHCNSMFYPSHANSVKRNKISIIATIISIAITISAIAMPNLTNLSTLSTKYKFEKPDITYTTITYKSKLTTLIFHPNSRRLLVNGTLVWMNAAPIKKKKTWYITATDFSSVIEPFLTTKKLNNLPKTPLIIIDPGHGGGDPGAIGKGKVFEKDIVLDIAKQLTKDLLKHKNINVTLTRATDVTISLSERSNIAKKTKADLFLSIHINATDNTTAQGIESYVLPAKGFPSTSGQSDRALLLSGNKFDRQNSLFAYCIHQQLVTKTGSPDRGIRRARFDVLRNAPCPAVLVECGFISNQQEVNKLKTKQYCITIAQAIADGIHKYLTLLKNESN